MFATSLRVNVELANVTTLIIAELVVVNTCAISNYLIVDCL